MGHLPDGVTDQRFDITAAIAPEDCCRWIRLSQAEQARPLQSVLRDRFHLQWHYETRLLPGFALVVAKGGPKFKPADPAEGCPGCMSGQVISMKQFAESLSLAIGTPILDQTGLTGGYRLAGWGRNSYMSGEPIEADGHPIQPPARSLADDLKPELGLALNYGAKVPVEFLIIDNIDLPSEN